MNISTLLYVLNSVKLVYGVSFPTQELNDIEIFPAPLSKVAD